jgi:hypothetical protein
MVGHFSLGPCGGRSQIYERVLSRHDRQRRHTYGGCSQRVDVQMIKALKERLRLDQELAKVG